MRKMNVTSVLIPLCLCFFYLSVSSAEKAEGPKERILKAMIEQGKVQSYAEKIKTGKLPESQRVADLKERMAWFLQGGATDTQAHSLRDAKLIAILAKPGDEFIVNPLLEKLLATQSEHMPLSVAAAIGKAIAKAQSPNLDEDLLIDSFRTSRQNLSLRLGLMNILVGMDTLKTTQAVTESLTENPSESLWTVRALKVTSSAKAIPILLQHGVLLSEEVLTRSEAMESIEAICKNNIKDPLVLHACSEKVFPKYLDFIRGQDPLSDADAASGFADTVAQQAYLSLVEICTASSKSRSLEKTCLVLQTLKGIKRIELQYNMVNLERIQREYQKALQMGFGSAIK